MSAEPTGAQPGGEGEPLKTSLKVAEVPKSEETRARILESLQGSLTLRGAPQWGGALLPSAAWLPPSLNPGAAH